MKNDISYEYRKPIFRNNLSSQQLIIFSCTKENLNSESITHGRIYHTTDTNEFFMDWNGNRLPMQIFNLCDTRGCVLRDELNNYVKTSDFESLVNNLPNADTIMIDVDGDGSEEEDSLQNILVDMSERLSDIEDEIERIKTDGYKDLIKIDPDGDGSEEETLLQDVIVNMNTSIKNLDDISKSFDWKSRLPE